MTRIRGGIFNDPAFLPLPAFARKKNFHSHEKKTFGRLSSLESFFFRAKGSFFPERLAHGLRRARNARKKKLSFARKKNFPPVYVYVLSGPLLASPGLAVAPPGSLLASPGLLLASPGFLLASPGFSWPLLGSSGLSWSLLPSLRLFWPLLGYPGHEGV